jgi:hypothetical protein
VDYDDSVKYTADYDTFGDLNVGTMTTHTSVDMIDAFYFSNPCDEDLMKKYPALKQAWDHYQVVLKMCRAKEEEE